MKVTDFGATVKGDETKLYTLTNKNGMEIAVSDYGATLVQVIVPDKEGKPCDVVLGYDEAAGYEEGDLFFGAIVGRSANRIGGASFDVRHGHHRRLRGLPHREVPHGPDPRGLYGLYRPVPHLHRGGLHPRGHSRRSAAQGRCAGSCVQGLSVISIRRFFRYA